MVARGRVRAAVVVQARATSTRLPRKVSLDLAGRPVLDHVVLRCATIPGVDAVVVAVPAGREHEPVAELANTRGAAVVRGDEHDVLSRYHAAAEAVGADVIMRVTSDCPLIDPVVAADVLELVASGAADYATNNVPPLWPHGLDCEAFTRDLLEEAAASAIASDDREHVSPWMRRNPDLRRVSLLGPGGFAAEQRWTIDYPEDLEMARALFAHLPDWPEIPSTAEVLDVARAHPEIAAINASRRGVSRPTAPETDASSS